MDNLLKDLPIGNYETEVVSAKLIEGTSSFEVILHVNPVTPDQKKYFVFYSPNKIYTAIGADNQHHAANKATKLWHGLWTSISLKPPNSTYYKYLPVTEFGKWIKETAKKTNGENHV